MRESTMRVARRLLLINVIPVLIFSGCASSGDEPRMYTAKWKYQDYKRVAVLPAKMKNPAYSDIADIITEDLTARLAASGQFEVISLQDLKETMDQQTWSQISDVDPSTAIPAGRIKAVQVLIIPTVTVVEAKADRSRAAGGGYGQSGGGGGEMEFMVNSATVGASVRVIDTATAQILVSASPEPIRRQLGTALIPPSQSPESLAAEAARKISMSLASAIVPTEGPAAK